MHAALNGYGAKHSVAQTDFFTAEPHHLQQGAISKIV